jgi:peptidoglycan/xylan/chitin deacetylase (PgdA/CDA1 family)
MLSLVSQARRRLATPEFRRPRFWWSYLRGERLRILMYHSIVDNPRDPHAIRPAVFEAQMQALADEHCEIVSLDEGVRRLQKRESVQNAVAITFDDAYRDFLTTALPILERFGLPVTLFVPTGHVGGTAVWDSNDKTKQLMDWDELREAARRGVTLASHTISHPRLTECDDVQLHYELHNSLETLRSRAEKVCPALAYPAGAYGPREMQAASHAGYVCALGTSSRWGNGHDTDLFALRREGPAPL